MRFVKAGVRLARCKVAVDGYSLSYRISELVRAGSPHPLVICDRGSPCLRLLACHLQTSGRPNGDRSLSTTSVDRRGPPSMPRASRLQHSPPGGGSIAKNPTIRAAINARVATAAMAADEVLARIADLASADLTEFLDVDPQGVCKVNLKLIKRLGLGHLIKRLRINKDGTSGVRKSGVGSSFLPEEMNRHRITPHSARKDEPTPDYAPFCPKR